jgi:hypothetical protein
VGDIARQPMSGAFYPFIPPQPRLDESAAKPLRLLRADFCRPWQNPCKLGKTVAHLRGATRRGEMGFYQDNMTKSNMKNDRCIANCMSRAFRILIQLISERLRSLKHPGLLGGEVPFFQICSGMPHPPCTSERPNTAPCTFALMC